MRSSTYTCQGHSCTKSIKLQEYGSELDVPNHVQQLDARNVKYNGADTLHGSSKPLRTTSHRTAVKVVTG